MVYRFFGVFIFVVCCDYIDGVFPILYECVICLMRLIRLMRLILLICFFLITYDYQYHYHYHRYYYSYYCVFFSVFCFVLYIYQYYIVILFIGLCWINIVSFGLAWFDMIEFIAVMCFNFIFDNIMSSLVFFLLNDRCLFFLFWLFLFLWENFKEGTCMYVVFSWTVSFSFVLFFFFLFYLWFWLYCYFFCFSFVFNMFVFLSFVWLLCIITIIILFLFLLFICVWAAVQKYIISHCIDCCPLLKFFHTDMTLWYKKSREKMYKKYWLLHFGLFICLCFARL